jgi:hypothetical protein
LLHLGTAEPAAAQVRLPAAEFVHEMRGMMVAARLADGKENVHGSGILAAGSSTSLIGRG